MTRSKGRGKKKSRQHNGLREPSLAIAMSVGEGNLSRKKEGDWGMGSVATKKAREKGGRSGKRGKVEREGQANPKRGPWKRQRGQGHTPGLTGEINRAPG